jgi:hypothetical protein
MSDLRKIRNLTVIGLVLIRRSEIIEEYCVHAQVLFERKLDFDFWNVFFFFLVLSDIV